QQHVLAPVTEIFRHPGAIHGRAQAHQRRIIGRGSHHYRAGHALLAEDLLDEFLDLPAPLADQANDGNVRLGKARHHAQQHTLAHAAAGKQAQALAPADGEHAVDGTDADIQRLFNGMTLEGIDYRTVEVYPVFALERALAVQRPTDTVQHPAEHVATHRQLATARGGPHPRPRLPPLPAVHRHQVDLAAGNAPPLRLDPGVPLPG